MTSQSSALLFWWENHCACAKEIATPQTISSFPYPEFRVCDTYTARSFIAPPPLITPCCSATFYDFLRELDY